MKVLGQLSAQGYNPQAACYMRLTKMVKWALASSLAHGRRRPGRPRPARHSGAHSRAGHRALGVSSDIAASSKRAD
jgi:hypothetical protein